MKSGLAQLREEKYRFTVETQGLSYTTNHLYAGARAEDTVWSDDDDDRQETRRSPPVAQRMATELTKVFQEGGGLTDDILERVLSASLLSNAGASGYDAAKDYVKQVMGQLFGQDEEKSGSADPDRSGRPSTAAQPLEVSRSANASNTSNPLPTQDLPVTGRAVTGFSSAPKQLLAPQQVAPGPTTGQSEQAPPPWTALARGFAATTAGGSGAVGGAGRHADEEMERPRPRPHHGFIREQLNLLQNADQLAAIISVATTAATTAATAAVKQSLQAPPPLPPGAFARMHAAGHMMPGLADFIPAPWAPMGLPQPTGPGGTSAVAAASTQGNQAYTFLEDSPDPQPQERRGTLVAPHQRATPIFAARRMESDGQKAAENHPAVLNPSGFQRNPQGNRLEVPSGMALYQHEAETAALAEGLQQQGQLGQGWALKRLAMPRGMPPQPGAAEAGDTESGGADVGQHAIASAKANEHVCGGSAMGGGSSNLRVVNLGAPRIIARTPPPVRPAFQRTPAMDAEGKVSVGILHGVGAGAAVFQSRSPDEEFTRAPAQGPRVHPPPGGQLREDGWLAARGPRAEDIHAAEDVSGVAGTHGGLHAGAHIRNGHLAVTGKDGAVTRQEYGNVNQRLVEDGAGHHAAGRPVESAGAPRPQLAAAAQRFQEGDAGGVEVPADGLFVTGGHSIFARAGAGAANALAGAAVAQPPQQPRRAALPEDVQHVFRSTLAFISDPDGARPQPPQPLSWAAMGDVKDREEAQREAEELLGGPFHYAAVKRELQQARRSSRLLQPAVMTSTSAPHGPTAASVALGAVQGGGVARARGDRSGGVPHAGVTSGAATAAPGRVPRGDFAGLLPPPHSVWDIDEAWFDLDEFTKAVEADVAYRAAAPGGTQHMHPRRGSPAAKPLGPAAATAATLDTRGGGLETNKAQTRRVNVAVDQPGAPAAPVPSSGQMANPAAARGADRKRSSSPGPTRVPTGAADASPSPPRPTRKSQTTGAVRIAFGRRVEEPQLVHDTTGTRARSSSPPATGESPERRVQKRKAKPAAAAAAGKRPGRRSLPAAADTASLPSTDDDPVHQVLSALASVLMSEEEEDSDGDDGGEGVVRNADRRDDDYVDGGDSRGNLQRTDTTASAATYPQSALPEAAAAAAGPEAARVEAIPREPQPEEPRAVEEPPGARLALHRIGVQLEEPTFTGSAPSEAAAATARAHIAPPNAPPPPSAVASVTIDGSYVSTTGAVAPLPPDLGLPSAAAAVPTVPAPHALAPPPWLQPGLQPWPPTTSTARPRFQYVVDTAHPPLTRLPAWAAAAADAVGGPAAFAAVVGAAPSGLGAFGTPSRRYPGRSSPNGGAAVRDAATSQEAALALEARGGLLEEVGDAVQPATKWPYAYGGNMQQPVFPAPGGLDSGMQIFPAPAAAAAVPAAVPFITAGKSKGRADPIQPLESALLQAVEDEVVSRMVVAQLASLGSATTPAPDELPGSLPLLVDEDLSRRLVCDVLREHLDSLLTAQQHQQQQGRMTSAESEAGPTLEEIVAAIARVPVMPARLQHTSMQTQPELHGTSQQTEQQRTANSVDGPQLDDQGIRFETNLGAPFLEAVRSSLEGAMRRDSASDGTEAAADAGARDDHTSTTSGSVNEPQHEQAVLDMADAAVSSFHSGQPASASLHSSRQSGSASSSTRDNAAPVASVHSDGSVASGSEVTPVPMQATSRSQRAIALSPAFNTQLGQQQGPEQSPSRSLGIQVNAVQARALQAAGVEARGTQLAGVQARGTQLAGVETRGTQLAGVQERATQAAGVMDSASQADPQPPHYLLQAALAAGLSYGAGPGMPPIPAVQPVLGPDGQPLAMPRAFYLAPADLAQQLSSLGLHGANAGFTLLTYGQPEGKRPPLNLPGLSKMRDSSEVESSTDSIHRNLRGPGARARARAAEALRLADRGSLDSDDGLLQRSYAPLELSSLMARPVRLEQHRSTVTDSTRETRSTVAFAVEQSGSRHEAARMDEASPTGDAAPGVGTAGQDTRRPGSDTRQVSSDSANSKSDTARQALHSKNSEARRTSRSESEVAAPHTLTQTRSSNHSTQSSHTSRTKTSINSIVGNVEQAALDPGHFSAVEPVTVDAPDARTGWRSGFGSSSVLHTESGDMAGAAAPSGDGPSRAHSLRSSGPSSRASKDHIGQTATDLTAEESKQPVDAAGATSPAVSDDEYVQEYGDEDDLDDIQSVHFGSSDDEAVRESLTELPGTVLNAVTARRPQMDEEEEQEEAEEERTGDPASGIMVSGRLAAAESGGRDRLGSPAGDSTERGSNNRAANDEVADFALSDDELLDEAEVSRVLEEEDARSVENEEAMPSESPGDSYAGTGRNASIRDAERAVTYSRGASLAGSERSLRPGSVREQPGTDSDGNLSGEDDAQRGPENNLREPFRVEPLGSDIVECLDEEGQTSSGSDGYQSLNGRSVGGSDAVMASGAAQGLLHSFRSATNREGLSEGERDGENRAGSGGGEDETTVRSSLDRMAAAGLVPLGHPRVRAQHAGSSSSGGTRVQGTNLVPMPLEGAASGQAQAYGQLQARPVLTPLQLTPLQQSTVMGATGTLQQPPSPGKPPSLADYPGLKGRLWRPPSAPQPHDPLLSSSETLMASSEASGPVLDTLSRALRDADRRGRMEGPTSKVTAVLARAQASGLVDSLETSALDVSASADSDMASTIASVYTAAGVMLPRMLTGGTAAPFLARDERVGPRRQQGGEEGNPEDSDDESENWGPSVGGLQRAALLSMPARQGSVADSEASMPGRGSNRRDGAVFRLRQFGARRRKLLQQIGVKDPLLMSSTTSLSTESTGSTSEEGDIPIGLARVGLARV